MLLNRVEVVGEVLGVGVTDLPTRRKTGVRLVRADVSLLD